ncbi:Lrp/AsnC family transcriptional regulator [Candidatus Woesearchaeota archaeon]|jgi:Lrp/AsnC family transcriptional regulator, regulator for asnA, asnC and gidA|nr:Lrp/AsnC family transcriptional regulator [Candidatus Woesearchaeota archaeon]MBT6518467.1 Lrp/AsnC family transcriptional regulator [Candidatus Woesearchaeota archaeon]MBT7366846.1 Lrp/AsnC family transcriptional regulator [Candidatus Woesearchaeota archaeon]
MAESFKLDKKDIKIIHSLCKNSRQSFSHIASVVGLSKNSVSYRVDRLLKNKIIHSFNTTVNIGALGYYTYNVLIKLRASPEEEKQVHDFLAEFPFTDWLATLSGSWDILLELVVKDTDHFEQILDKIFEAVGDKIEVYKTFISRYVYKVLPIAQDFFGDIKLSEQETDREQGIISIDKTDAKLLSIISADALIPVYKLGEKLNLSSDAVTYRIKKLKKSGIIAKFAPTFNIENLGYSEYLIMISLRNPKKEDFKKLKSHIVLNKNIQYAVLGSTSYEILMTAQVKNPIELDHLLKDLKNSFFNIINTTEFFLITDHPQFNLFPSGLVNHLFINK